jgi:hypothetical protein
VGTYLSVKHGHGNVGIKRRRLAIALQAIVGGEPNDRIVLGKGEGFDFHDFHGALL